MSARHSIAQHRRGKSRGRKIFKGRTTTPLFKIGHDTNPGRTARDWHRVNSLRLYIVTFPENSKVPVLIPTGFRNVIDEDGNHV